MNIFFVSSDTGISSTQRVGSLKYLTDEIVSLTPSDAFAT